MSRDADVYPFPDAFMPERYLDADGNLDLSRGDPADFVWGFGRRCVLRATSARRRTVVDGAFDRICPGRHFAEASLFAYAASILHVFNICPPLDEHGAPQKLEHPIFADDDGSVAT